MIGSEQSAHIGYSHMESLSLFDLNCLLPAILEIPKSAAALTILVNEENHE